jgi:O-antigen/teichoic acid export membrane protein
MSAADEADGPVRTFGASARASILWGGGFTLFRDVLQFATMIVLVRHVVPDDYGRAALAQSVLGLLSVASFATWSLHALQARDPAKIDWQSHFAAAAVINGGLALVTLSVAGLLSLTNRWAAASLPLAALSLVLVVEIAAALRIRMAQVAHDWRRFRVLLVSGSLLGSSAGIVIAMLGGGVWALVVQPVLLGLPAAADLIFIARWRPDWSWSWQRYRETARFGLARMGGGAMLNGRQTLEQSVLAGTYDFAALGVFTRTTGLAMLLAGRLGSVCIGALYPVITRSDPQSAQFRRHAGLLLRGVVWATTPAVGILTLAASEVTDLLYGPQWHAVVPLLPLAAASVGLSGIAATACGLLLANNESRACLALDIVSAVLGAALALWVVPMGTEVYLAALTVHGAVVLGLAVALLDRTSGIDSTGFLDAFLPAIVAGAAGAAAAVAARGAVEASSIAPVRLLVVAGLFCAVYVAVLRVAFEKQFAELLAVAPGGRHLTVAFALAPRTV